MPKVEKILTSRLDDLQKDVQAMEDWELIEFISDIRAERKSKKAVARSSGPRPKDKAKKSLKTLLSGLSKEEIKKMLETS